MCGIFGILNFDNEKININELKYYTRSLNHRGPDGEGFYIDNENNLGLGHTRTSIFDISDLGKQPMSYNNENFWITYNGEIYNFIELKKELISLGYNFKSETDTEVILAAYTEWGENCQFKFNGDWAFAIWNKKKKKLFLSCDRFGSKSLYYYLKNNSFIFASELKTFMYLKSELRPDIDYGFLLWLNKATGSSNTFLKNVISLNGGHQLNIDFNKKLRVYKWWRTIDNLVDIPREYEEQKLHFRDLFFNACKIRLRSDVPIASCLSGGLDSSSVVSTIAELRNKQVSIERFKGGSQNVFICDFVGDKNSEIEYANDVVKKSSVNPYYLKLEYNKINPEDVLKSSFDQESLDEPAIGPWLIYKMMRKNNIRVSIDGSGADESIGGFWVHPEIGMSDSFWPWSEKGRFDDLQKIRQKINLTENNLSRKKIFIKKIFGNKMYNLLANLKNNKSLFEKNYNLINKTKLEYPVSDDISKFDNLNQELYTELHQSVTPALCKKFDRISMAHGVESRAPFLDPNIITYLFSLPSNTKVGNGFTKRILRDSMAGLVPDTVLTRTDKKGYTPSPTWQKSSIQYLIKDEINSSDFLNSNVFSGKEIKKDFEKGVIHHRIVWRYAQLNYLTRSFKNLKSFK